MEVVNETRNRRLLLCRSKNCQPHGHITGLNNSERMDQDTDSEDFFILLFFIRLRTSEM